PQNRAAAAPHAFPTRRSPELAVVDQIRACRVILSSSLHGLVVAHAYGIPAAWVQFSDKLSGDGSKFRDHAASIGVELVPASDIHDASPVVGQWDHRPRMEVVRCLALTRGGDMAEAAVERIGKTLRELASDPEGEHGFWCTGRTPHGDVKVPLSMREVMSQPPDRLAVSLYRQAVRITRP